VLAATRMVQRAPLVVQVRGRPQALRVCQTHSEGPAFVLRREEPEQKGMTTVPRFARVQRRETRVEAAAWHRRSGVNTAHSTGFGWAGGGAGD
jgi:hypothetical protein